MIQADNLFNTSSIKFECENVNVGQVPIPIDEAKFGILNLKANSAPLSQEEHDFIFMVDRSGSMSDYCSDGRSKMQYIVHTLKNMISYFREHSSIKAHITIHAFDDNTYKIVERCAVDSSNFDEIIAKIDTIRPRQTTNIEEALMSIKNTASEIRTLYPQNNIINIFMTDGDATTGKTNPTELATLVDRNITNAFIGFGIQHDATLLNTIANGPNSEYYFIDKLENSGLVYGEILHGIVYKLLKNVTLTIQNGFIYDFKKNSWIDEIHIGEIVSEADKIYHIISNTPEKCIIDVTGETVSDNSKFKMIVVNVEESHDLTKYIYRQRTLQHLAIVSDFLKRKTDKDTFTIFAPSSISSILDNSKPLITEEKTIRGNLKKFIEEMKDYIAKHNLNDDKFLKNLCDDIYIVYRTLGTMYAAMYTVARQTSQGTQRCYTVSQTPDDDTVELYYSVPTQGAYGNIKRTCFPVNTKIQRQTNNQYEDEDDVFDDISHVVSNYADTPYLTPTSTRVMRAISCSYDNEVNII